MARPRHRGDGGYTLIEAMITMVLLSLLLAIVAGPWRNYQRSQDHIATTRRIVAVLRNAQTKAVAEATSYRVVFQPDGREYVVERLEGTSWVRPQSFFTDTQITFRDVAFYDPDTGGTGPAVIFYPRGSATKGQLVVARSGRSKTYTVTVEGLTARVSYQ